MSGYLIFYAIKLQLGIAVFVNDRLKTQQKLSGYEDRVLAPRHFGLWSFILAVEDRRPECSVQEGRRLGYNFQV